MFQRLHEPSHWDEFHSCPISFFICRDLPAAFRVAFQLNFPLSGCPSIRWKISRRLVGPPCLWSFSSILCTRFDGECHVDRCLFRSLESILSGFNGNSSLSALADGLSDVSFLGDDSFEYRCVFGDPSFGFYRLLPIDSPPPRQTLSYFCLFFSRAFLPFLLATVLLPVADANFSFDEKG